MVVVAIVEMNYVIAISFLIAGLNSDFLNFIYGSRITGHILFIPETAVCSHAFSTAFYSGFRTLSKSLLSKPSPDVEHV